MKNLEVQWDAGEVVDIGTEVAVSLKELNKVVTEMEVAVSKALSTVAESIQNVELNFLSI